MAVLGKVLITPKGPYVPGTSYVRLDCVYYSGSSWLALQPSTDIVPIEGQYWTLLARGYENVAFADLSGKPTTIEGYGITDAMSTSKIADNVTTTEEGFALDARQGKALQDQITLQNDNLNTNYLKYTVYNFSYTTTTATGWRDPLVPAINMSEITALLPSSAVIKHMIVDDGTGWGFYNAKEYNNQLFIFGYKGSAGSVVTVTGSITVLYTVPN